MNFHWCGNPFHDVLHNMFVLALMAPDWVPMAMVWKAWIRERAHAHESE